MYLLVVRQKFTDVSGNRPFESRRVSKVRNQKGAHGNHNVSVMALAGFILDLHFDTDDVGTTILRNVSEFLPNCTVLHHSVHHIHYIFIHLNEKN
jgi:hypothetical protein